MKASVVSPGTERAFIMTLENTDHNYPRVLGYSAAGVVLKVGRDVTDFKPGDRVAGIMPIFIMWKVEIWCIFRTMSALNRLHLSELV